MLVESKTNASGACRDYTLAAQYYRFRLHDFVIPPKNTAPTLAFFGIRLYNLTMSQPFKLYRLQQIDTQLDQARSRLKEIDNILKGEGRVKQAEAEASKKEKKLEEAQKALKRAEEDVQAQNIKIEQTESTLYGGKVRNPKELQDLQQEAAALKRYLAVLEDRQLDLMLVVEEAESLFNQAAQDLAEVRGLVMGQQATLVGERSKLEKDVERLEVERSAAHGSIEEEDLKLYDTLRRQRMGLAVTKVVDNSCSACGSTLTPSAVQTAHSHNQITRCTFCGRILYAG
jgi:uncharacterized protein